MVDWNERSTSAGSAPQKAVIVPTKPPAAPIPTPIWQSRLPLKPRDIAELLRTPILPHVARALRFNASPATVPADGVPFEVQRFTSLVLRSDESAPLSYVETLIAQGTPTDLIFLNLLTPTARRLGEMWEADITDFANVTLAVSRLQRILRHLGERFSDDERGTAGGAVLLTTTHGEQHSFGLSMVAEFFRRDGWDVCIGPFASHRDLFTLVQERWFDVVGFSITSDRRLDQTRHDIRYVRRDSRNRRVGVMVGGPMLSRQPELAASLSADAAGSDGSAAPRLARMLVAAMNAQPNHSGYSQLRSALL